MNVARFALTLLFATALERAAFAKERQKTCVDVAIIDVNPAAVEWGLWILSGAAHWPGPDIWRPVLGVGSEATVGVAEYVGFPAGGGPWVGRGEIRAGAWMNALFRGSAGLVEGGLKLHAGGIYAPRWGTFDLRAGLGFGEHPDTRARDPFAASFEAPHATAALLWGARRVNGREVRRGYCDPPSLPRAVAESSVLRLFFAARRPFREHAGTELSLGIDLSPTLVLSPCSSD